MARQRPRSAPPPTILLLSCAHTPCRDSCRALTLAAQDGLLTEGFFWIPSLGGPSTVDQQLAGTGMSWLFPFVDGQPPLGWETTIAYLIMPLLLVVSQAASQKIISPPTDDPAQQQTQNILKFIPLLIGAHSLRGASRARTLVDGCATPGALPSGCDHELTLTLIPCALVLAQVAVLAPCTALACAASHRAPAACAAPVRA